MVSTQTLERLRAASRNGTKASQNELARNFFRDIETFFVAGLESGRFRLEDEILYLQGAEHMLGIARSISNLTGHGRPYDGGARKEWC